MTHEPYGLLLALDGYGADPAACANEGLLATLLTELPGSIGMRRLSEPQIVRVEEPGIRGLSGFVFIMESHISIHTYEERGFVTADVYSCKRFATRTVIGRLTEAFDAASWQVHEVTRGTHFNDAAAWSRGRP